jgi:pilus assembly protein FimV
VQRLKIKQISLAVCLALMPFSSFAAGLGRLSVDSGLGEPFKAEIELLAVSPDELSTLVAVIASEEAYAEQGITRLGIHSNIKVEVAKNAAGEPVLKLRSSQAISDPYLDMLIQVEWASGRLQREYTILLDPPGYKPQAELVESLPTQAPVVSSKAITNTPAASVSGDTDISNTKKPTKKSNNTAAQKPADAASEMPAATKRGDTLYSIAKQMQVEGVSLDQMLIGLYENNKEAFSSNNMNRLKVGQIIKMPTKESLGVVTTVDATQQVKVHSANWNAYRDSLAAKVAAAPVQQETEQKQASSGKIATAADKALATKKAAQDVVKLSAGEKGAKDTQGLDAKISMLQDEAAARDKSLKDAQERTAVLEQQILDMQKLLALKNQAMSEAQKTAAQAIADNKPVASPGNAAAAEQSVVALAKVKPANTAPLGLPPELEPSLWRKLIDLVDLTLLSALASIALLTTAWMILRNKRRKDLDSFERGILTSGGLNSSTVFGNTSGRSSTTDTSFLTDFVRSADGSMIDTHDVDPIAEAEVYMAYGRDAQAEEILKDAISKEPQRYELQLKLLEMYAARKDNSAFEAVASELYTRLGADDVTWKKVAALGLSFDPENPLYQFDKALVAAATEKLDVSDFAADDAKDKALEFPLDIAATDVIPEAANVAVQQSFSAAQATEPELSFDLGVVAATDDSAADTALSQAAADSDVGNTQNALEPSQVATDVTAPINLAEANITAENINTAQPSEALNLSADNALDFDISELNTTAVEPVAAAPNVVDTAAEPTQAATDNVAANVLDLSALNSSSQVNDFDMDFDIPAEAAANSLESLEQKSELVADAIQDISFDFEAEEPVKPALAEAESNVSDLSFDLPGNDDYMRPDIAAQVEAPQANELDLSSISFDLDDASPTNALASSPELTEPPEVEIKLDLVAAYMDMGDKEGARELLEEVIKEGGEQQQLRAEKLLSSLS